MNDEKFIVINEFSHWRFEQKINAKLAEGCWRVVAVDIAVSDNRYLAFLIKRKDQGGGVENDGLAEVER